MGSALAAALVLTGNQAFGSDEPPKDPPKECKGKAAARALAVLVLDPKISNFLALNDPKALEQSLLALEPFGWPDLDALREKLNT